jgi:hypothetical protein
MEVQWPHEQTNLIQTNLSVCQVNRKSNFPVVREELKFHCTLNYVK